MRGAIGLGIGNEANGDVVTGLQVQLDPVDAARSYCAGTARRGSDVIRVARGLARDHVAEVLSGLTWNQLLDRQLVCVSVAEVLEPVDGVTVDMRRHGESEAECGDGAFGVRLSPPGRSAKCGTFSSSVTKHSAT